MSRARRFPVVRAGDFSLHRTRADASLLRSFDLIAGGDGRDSERCQDAPLGRIDDEGRKPVGPQRRFERETHWRDDDRVRLPGDDLAIELSGIDLRFECRSDPDVARPSPQLAVPSCRPSGLRASAQRRRR